MKIPLPSRLSHARSRSANARAYASETTCVAVRLLGRHWLLCIGMMSSAAALGAVSVWHEHAVVMVAAVILGAGLGV